MTTDPAFGWCVPMWPIEDLPMETLRQQTINHLEALKGRFDSIWLSDHVVPGTNWREPTAGALECWTATLYYAALYPDYIYSHRVMNNSFRHPALLAKMAATAQFLMHGHLILGIGAGWKEDEYRSYGYDYPKPGVRISQLEEGLEIMRRMWTESPASYEGKYYHIANAYCEPRPDPMIPILIGGGGEQRTLRVTARLADLWNMPGGSAATFARKVGLLTGYCEEINRDPATLGLTWDCSCVSIAPDEVSARKQAETFPFHVHQEAGTSAIGTSEMVADHLRQFKDLGCSHFILRFADFPRLDGVLQFAEEVIPLLRGV